MQEDDVPASIIELIDRSGDNLLDSWTTPIIGIDLHPDGDISEFIGSDQGEDIRWRLRLNIFSIGRTKEARLMSKNTLEYSFCEREFDIRMNLAYLRNFWMREAMIPDKMPFIIDAFHNVRIFLSAHSDHEECCGCTILLQNIENCWRIYWIGPIIEGEDDFFSRSSTISRYHIGKGIGHDILIRDDIAFGIDRTDSLFREAGHLVEFTRAIIGECISIGKFFEGLFFVSFEYFPDRWIF